MKFIKDNCETYINVSKVKRVRIWLSGGDGELWFDNDKIHLVPRDVARMIGEMIEQTEEVKIDKEKALMQMEEEPVKPIKKMARKKK